MVGSWKRVFEGLFENQRQMRRLFFVEGYTLGEIAVKVNQARENVNTTIFAD